VSAKVKTAQDEWIRLDEWKADSAIVQSLTAVHIWPTLTQKQRHLVAACRIEVDPKAVWPNRYKVRIDGIQASPATMRSLERKSIVDYRGHLTVVGIYTALWNQLENDEKRRAERAARKAA
jgi:hypothetical protein